MNQVYVINQEDSHRVALGITDALGSLPGSDEIDARDLFAGVAEFVAMLIRFNEDAGLGDRDEWRRTMNDMLLELLDDGGPL